MSNVTISKFSDGTNTGYIAPQAIFECTTAAGTAAKVATSPNNVTFSNTSLVNGVTVYVHFNASNTASSPTLQVGTSTAKLLLRADAGGGTGTFAGETVVGSWKAGAIVAVTYHESATTGGGTTGAWVINNHSEAVGSIVVGSTTLYPEEYNAITQKPTGSVDLTSAIDSRISAAGVLPSVSASDNGKALKVVNGAWAVANFDKPEKIFYAIPLAESSGSYVLSPTSSAARWQFSDEDHVDWQTGTVSKWFTADEIHELWKAHNIVFMEILIDDEYSSAGLVTYYECIETVTEGIEQPLLSFIENGWDPGGASATFANFEKNKKIILTFTSPFVSTAAYGMVGSMPTTIPLAMENYSLLFIALLSETSAFSELPQSFFSSIVPANYIDLITSIQNTGTGQFLIKLSNTSSVCIPINTINSSVLSGSGYVAFPSNITTVYEGFVKLLFAYHDDAWHLYVGSYVPTAHSFVQIVASHNDLTDAWTFSPTMSTVWNDITDAIDHMAVVKDYWTGNIILQYNGDNYHLTHWTYGGSSNNYSLTFANYKDNLIQQLTYTSDSEASPSETVDFSTFTLNGPPVTILCVPVNTNSTNATPVLTENATIWQMTTMDRMDFSTGTATWLSGEEIDNYLRNNTVTFQEIEVTSISPLAAFPWTLFPSFVNAVRDVDVSLSDYLTAGLAAGLMYGDNVTFACPTKKIQITTTHTDTDSTASYLNAAYGSITITLVAHTHGNITNDGKIGSTANQAVYTTTNGVLTAGTLPTTATNAALSQLPTWSATPTDTTMLLRRDTGGTASYGQVAFSTVNNYIKTKNPVLDHLTYDSTEEAVKFIWS